MAAWGLRAPGPGPPGDHKVTRFAMNDSEPTVGQPANGIPELAFSPVTGQNTQKQFRNWNLRAVQSLLIISFSFFQKCDTFLFLLKPWDFPKDFGVACNHQAKPPHLCVCVCSVVGVWAGDDVSIAYLSFTCFLVLDGWDGAPLPHDNQLINVPFMSFFF